MITETVTQEINTISFMLAAKYKMLMIMVVTWKEHSELPEKNYTNFLVDKIHGSIFMIKSFNGDIYLFIESL